MIHSKKIIRLIMAALIAVGFFCMTISAGSNSVSADQVKQTDAKMQTLNVYAKNTTTIVQVINKNILAKVKAPNQSSQRNMSSKNSQVKSKKPSKQTPTSSTPAVSGTTTNSSVTPAKVKRERNNYVNGQLGRPPLTPSDERKQSSDTKIISQATKSLPKVSTIISTIVIIVIVAFFIVRGRRFHLFAE